MLNYISVIFEGRRFEQSGLQTCIRYVFLVELLPFKNPGHVMLCFSSNIFIHFHPFTFLELLLNDGLLEQKVKHVFTGFYECGMWTADCAEVLLVRLVL